MHAVGTPRAHAATSRWSERPSFRGRGLAPFSTSGRSRVLRRDHVRALPQCIMKGPAVGGQAEEVTLRHICSHNNHRKEASARAVEGIWPTHPPAHTGTHTHTHARARERERGEARMPACRHTRGGCRRRGACVLVVAVVVVVAVVGKAHTPATTSMSASPRPRCRQQQVLDPSACRDEASTQRRHRRRPATTRRTPSPHPPSPTPSTRRRSAPRSAAKGATTINRLQRHHRTRSTTAHGRTGSAATRCRAPRSG